MPGAAGLSCRSNAVVFTAFCSCAVRRESESVKVSAMRNSILRPPCGLGPECMDLVQLGDPAFENVPCVPAEPLGQLEKSRPRLHIAALMNDDNRQHAAARGVFLG